MATRRCGSVGEPAPSPKRPVVIQRVDGGSQWLQDTVEDTPTRSGHRAPGRGVGSEPGSDATCKGSAAAPGHGLQISPVGRRRDCLGGDMKVQESLLVWWHLPGGLQPAASSPLHRCTPAAAWSLTADHVNKVWQECCNLGVGLQVVETI